MFCFSITQTSLDCLFSYFLSLNETAKRYTDRQVKIVTTIKSDGGTLSLYSNSPSPPAKSTWVLRSRLQLRNSFRGRRTAKFLSLLILMTRTTLRETCAAQVLNYFCSLCKSFFCLFFSLYILQHFLCHCKLTNENLRASKRKTRNHFASEMQEKAKNQVRLWHLSQTIRSLSFVNNFRNKKPKSYPSSHRQLSDTRLKSTIL